MNDFASLANILVKLIVGGRDRIFTEFTMLQKKPNENHLYFFEKLKNYYFWMKEDGEKMEDDPTAFRMIKSKMIQAYPSRFVPEFKRRLEGKSKLNDIFEAILEMTEEYPDIMDNDGNGGSDVMALMKKNESWLKNVKCYKCGKKGHIAKNCYSKRESKTPKDGRKNE